MVTNDGNARIDIARQEEWVRSAVASDPALARWAAGYGPITHSTDTVARVIALATELQDRDITPRSDVFEILHAADRVTSAAMWLVVHETYARSVYLDGRDLTQEDFKADPEGHTGGSLNMAPAYVGYMAANAVTNITRSWVMGQGHTVSAIDSVNLLLDNMTSRHADRFSLSDEGLTRYVRDFYAYRIGPDGRQASPLGSHVNPNTGGAMIEGGYLGFTELQYVHMPLPGESLVCFLSDGAFEEQRGSDWAPRWWRAQDSGLVMPIMIANGRRIDQRTTMNQEGGVDWFIRYLRLNSFEPILLDGRDPAAFAWAILEQEQRLAAAGALAGAGQIPYPVPMPYGIATSPKGAGFYGEGTNLAHNLPLGANPSQDPEARMHFNMSARRLWVPLGELKDAVEKMRNHECSGRPRERDHPLAHRDVSLSAQPALSSFPVAGDLTNGNWTRHSPMESLDAAFVAVVEANPHLRPRVGNPDEMRSNRMQKTLDTLLFRVTAPEPKLPEGVLGKVVTALNEEAVCCAAIGNKGGINIVVTYEAFATKMHGALRQEVTWSEGMLDEGEQPGWLSLPLVLTSHAWENAKNERSHQDPGMAELMLGELAPGSRVLFPPDANSAAETLLATFRTQGQIWTLVVPKATSVPDLFSVEEARELLARGLACLEWAGDPDPQIILTAVGAYQLEEILKAARRLRERGVRPRVVYMIEPARLRAPRTKREAVHAAEAALVESLYPRSVAQRIFVSHTRPGPMMGVLKPLDTGPATRCLGFSNAGGTLSTPGMLFVNGASWAHITRAALQLLALDDSTALEASEIEALEGRASPHGVVIPDV